MSTRPRGSRAVSAGLLFGCVLALSQTSRAVQQPVFRAATDVVTVDVAVTRGRTPVSALTADDFVLFDNGVRQTIDGVVTGTQPVDVTVLLGGGLLSQQDQVRQSMIDMKRVQAMLHAEDRIRVVECGADAREISPMQPADQAVPLRSFIASVRYRGTQDSSALPFNDALFYALAWPANPGRRHLVVAFTSGFNAWSTTSAALVPELASRADAVLHAVLFESPPQAPSNPGTGTRGEWVSSDGSTHLPPAQVIAWRASFAAMDEAVTRTGGALHRFSNGVDDLQQVLDDFRGSYVLHYTPRGVARAGWHDLKVSVSKSGSFDVRARKGYQGR
jgi:VWFA-related protein